MIVIVPIQYCFMELSRKSERQFSLFTIEIEIEELGKPAAGRT